MIMHISTTRGFEKLFDILLAKIGPKMPEMHWLKEKMPVLTLFFPRI